MISPNKEHPFMLEIEGFEYAMEVLCSRFDNAIDLIPDKAVIFGGAIRDILAKMELKSDLDILCHSNLYGKILNRQFLNDPRWCLINASSDLIHTNENYGFNPAGEIEDVVGEIHEPPIIALESKITKAPVSTNDLSKYLEQIVSFINIDGAVVQVMVVRQNVRYDFVNLPLTLARQVDLICCGLIMTKDGKIFEVVPDAYKDCINRVLRLNPNSHIISAKRTTKRIEKLVGRGWTSAITDKELAEAEKRSEESSKEELLTPSKLKPSFRRFDKSSVIEAALSAPHYPPEKKRKYVPHRVGTERISGEYRPTISGTNSDRSVSSASIEALENRVADMLHNKSISPIDVYMDIPLLKPENLVREVPIKAYPDVELKRGTLFERLTATEKRNAFRTPYCN